MGWRVVKCDTDLVVGKGAQGIPVRHGVLCATHLKLPSILSVSLIVSYVCVVHC